MTTRAEGTAPSFGFTPGDVIIVTGAGSGIGRASALAAGRVGLTVSAWDLDRASAERTADDITAAGGRALAVVADVGDQAAVDAGYAAAGQVGTIRHLLNNAGPSSFAPLSFEEALALCVGSMRRMVETWLALGTPPGASVVNVASVAGNIVATDPDWYPSSKAAIAGYTRYLAVKKVDRLRANAVAPGMTDTPRLTGFKETDLGRHILNRIPMHRLGDASEIAWAALFLLSPLASYVNGVLLPVDGGWTLAQ